MYTSIKRFDIRVSMVYATIATLWIILSDSFLALFLNGNVTKLAGFSILKGLGFVAVTATALYGVLHTELLKRDRIDRALQEDILERNKTLDALRQSESRFSTIFHRSPVPIVITHLEDAAIVDANDALAKMLGYERHDLIAKTTPEVGLWVNPEKRAEAVASIAKTGSLHNHEIHGRTRSDKPLILLVSAELIAFGDVPHVVSILYDVTDQRQLEVQTRYHAMLLAHVSDAVISTDLDFKIRSWNPAAELIYGWRADEVIGKPVEEIVRGNYSDTPHAALIQQLYRAGSWRGEATHHRRDGSPVHLLASTSYITDSAGNRTGLVTVNRDITERMKAQEELREAERQRTQIEKERELLQLKERFVSVVSHEFRTPLAVIYTAAEMMHRYYERMTPDRLFKQIHEILGQADYMVGLLDDVLTVNKARAGRLEFNPAPFYLLAFCQATIERIQAVDDGKHTINFVSDGYMGEVLLDSKLLQHILVNLLSNAVKYSPDGGEVRLEVLRSNGSVTFRVSDQGIGIPPEGLARLYDPFYRASNTRNIKGTGLGLTIVKESVDLHNGTIRCESEEGVGTTFTVQLPTSSEVHHDSDSQVG
ncbi:MAG: PAS domain S-box protein [Anaerolineae bacterium]|nr:PAS domain S-box protein [Anaerolineae bacterium]